ncbi:hypothetical protein [Caulobacter sp. 17J80-11]|uniref:hypothetical protein n=1 Tax=Caulobacter sp. 17J80-11 TaxID=2763502 RepID=UPI001653BCD4|nr:hypothetical protein [Caulobacter sp. 17J80-11]MBC6981903.1 hypothetical protein [Caulobacter sp. 17J80-11]
MPLARTAAAILVLTGVFWIVAAWYAADRGPTVARKAPPPFASDGRHRAAPDAG